MGVSEKGLLQGFQWLRKPTDRGHPDTQFGTDNTITRFSAAVLCFPYIQNPASKDLYFAHLAVGFPTHSSRAGPGLCEVSCLQTEPIIHAKQGQPRRSAARLSPIFGCSPAWGECDCLLVRRSGPKANTLPEPNLRLSGQAIINNTHTPGLAPTFVHNNCVGAHMVYNGSKAHFPKAQRC
jgi:hypothetical protein